MGATGASAGAAGASTGGTGGTGGSNTGGTGNVGATGGSNTGGTGNVAGGTGGTGGADAGPPPLTLDNVCSILPSKFCALKQSCCQKTVGYDQQSCESNEQSDCENKVAEVKSGQRSFHPALIAACLSAVEPLYNACWFSGDQLAAYRLTSNVCDAIFDLVGAGPGTDCTSTSDCSSSTQPNGYAYCNNSNQCAAGMVLGLGANCSSGLCGPGLYCQTTPQGSTCAKAVALGGNCNSSAECGLGFYCTQGHCAVAQPESGSCSSDLQCLSLSCTYGQCDAQPTYVDGQACGV